MIPFLDLKAQYAAIGGDVETAVLNVLRSGDFVLAQVRASRGSLAPQVPRAP